MMQKKISLAFLALMMLVAGGDKTSKNIGDADSLPHSPNTSIQESAEGEAVKHSKEYITQRIDTIYNIGMTLSVVLTAIMNSQIKHVR